MKNKSSKHQGLVAATGMSTAMLAIVTAGMAVHEGLFHGSENDLSIGCLIGTIVLLICFIVVPRVSEKEDKNE